MAPLQRPLSWYQSWLIATPERAQVARELLEDIKGRNYNSQTLEEIILVIDHECLCRVGLINLHGAEESIAIGTLVIGDFAEQLSSCLVQHINPNSHLLRELQCRALLSVLALLHLDGVTAQETDFYTKWQSQINKRFRDLVWLPGQSTGLSKDTFRRVQCLHLLSLEAAYHARHFIRAEPASADILAIASNVMHVGVMAVNIALV